MTVTAVLRKDHEILRRKLEFLEAALRVAPVMPFALREMCHSLQVILEEHLKREEEALRPYGARLAPVMRARETDDHADLRAVLHDISALLLLGARMPASTLVTRLTGAIAELREHMDEEEREMFPIIERFETGEDGAQRTPGPMILPAMSANAVMKAFPRTRQVFERHGVACWCEGCDCLDELAWRHGMSSDELIAELRSAAHTPEHAGAAAGETDEAWPEATSHAFR